MIRGRNMNFRNRILVALWTTLLSGSVCFAQGVGVERDQTAVDVLNSMSEYTASLDRLVLRGTAFTDGRLQEGLIVSNASEVVVTIDRPGSMHLSNFDGVTKKELFFHEGSLTLFDSERNFYAQASIPNDIDAAAEFALEEMGIEAPMMDLIYRDIASQLAAAHDSVIYLTDKARVGGVDCHHIAIRGPEVDIQVWVEEGDRPVPRKIMITSKWEGGAPRFFANMVWDSSPQIAPSVFEFVPPEGATDIGFVSQASKP